MQKLGIELPSTSSVALGFADAKDALMFVDSCERWRPDLQLTFADASTVIVARHDLARELKFLIGIGLKNAKLTPVGSVADMSPSEAAKRRGWPRLNDPVGKAELLQAHRTMLAELKEEVAKRKR